MKFIKYSGALVLAATLATGAAQAVTLQQGAKPRETPPGNYRGDVYVDSRGCAYARASLGNTTNWVPRLSADRKSVVCGLTPTFAAGAPRATQTPAPIAPPAPADVATSTTGSDAAPTATQPVSTPATVQAARRPATNQRTGFFASLFAPTNAAMIVNPGTAAAQQEADRRLDVTCPADGGNPRVRIGGATVAVNCGASMTSAQVYRVQHRDGAMTELVASPSPIVAAQAAQVPSYRYYRPAVVYRRQGPIVPHGVSSRVVVAAPIDAVPSLSTDGTRVVAAPRVKTWTRPIGSPGSGHYYGPPTSATYESYLQQKAAAYAAAGIPFEAARELQAAPLATPRYHRAPQRYVQPNEVALPAPYVRATTAPLSNPVVAPAPRVPDGYRSAWDDDRLNDERGPRTVQGEVDMQYMWTNTVPRRLVPVE